LARTLSALRPFVEAWEWQSVGRCREPGGAQFFHPDEDLGRISRRLREAAAIRLCQSCPVRAECATHALTVGEEYGVWGGFTENDRTVLREAGWQDALGEDRLVDVARLRQRVDRLRSRTSRDAPAGNGRRLIGFAGQAGTVGEAGARQHPGSAMVRPRLATEALRPGMRGADVRGPGVRGPERSAL
jgi:WhiB family redox-sensing transcriptional regulator